MHGFAIASVPAAASCALDVRRISPCRRGLLPRYTAACPNSSLASPTCSHPPLNPPPSRLRPSARRLTNSPTCWPRLRAAERLPWPSLTVAAAVEQRYLNLARIAGAEGQKLAAAIMDEAERLFSADEQEAVRRAISATSLRD